MNVAIVHTINTTVLKKLEAKKINAVIYSAIDPDINPADIKNVQLINIFDDFVNASHFSFNYNKQKLDSIRKKIPGLFQFKGYDLSHALEKDLFFGRLHVNAIQFQIKKLDSPTTRYFDYYSRPRHIKLTALFKRLFLGKNFLYQFVLPDDQQKISPDTIAFRINSLELIELYGDLIPKLKGRSILSFQNSVNGNSEKTDQTLRRFFKLNIKSTVKASGKNKINFKTRVRLFLMSSDCDFTNVLTDSLFKLINHTEEYEKLMARGVRKLFVAGAENEGEGNVITSVAKKYGCVTYNYMNGAKAKDEHNVHTYFDYWFMPNLTTKDMILSYCNVTNEQLPVTGHLLEEKAHNYKYSGTLDYLNQKIQGKKVISVLTSFYLKEQTDVLNFLAEYIDKKENYIVLVRKHPSDKGKEKVTHPKIIYLQKTETGTPFQNLFDFLSISDITISFSSTVSLQSSWFMIPTLNFAYSAVSMLPYVDDKTIMHVNSLERLNELLNKYLAEKNDPQINRSFSSASDNIIKILEAS
jgi:hypothetical protein